MFLHPPKRIHILQRDVCCDALVLITNEKRQMISLYNKLFTNLQDVWVRFNIQVTVTTEWKLNLFLNYTSVTSNVQLSTIYVFTAVKLIKPTRHFKFSYVLRSYFQV